MIVATMGHKEDPYSFVVIDEVTWSIKEKIKGQFVIGACLVGQSLYYFLAGQELWRCPIRNAIPIVEEAVNTGLTAPGAHSLIALDGGSRLAFPMGDNEIWVVDPNDISNPQFYAPTSHSKSDYSHINGLTRDNRGWWYLSMLCWHRADNDHWRDRERLGLIARFENPCDLNPHQIDILHCELAAPHSVVWNEQLGLCFCESKASRVWLGGKPHITLDVPYFVRGLLVEPPLVWFAASPQTTNYGVVTCSRLYCYNLTTNILRYLDLGTEDDPTMDVYDLVRTQ